MLLCAGFLNTQTSFWGSLKRASLMTTHLQRPLRTCMWLIYNTYCGLAWYFSPFLSLQENGGFPHLFTLPDELVNDHSSFLRHPYLNCTWYCIDFTTSGRVVINSTWPHHPRALGFVHIAPCLVCAHPESLWEWEQAACTAMDIDNHLL